MIQFCTRVVAVLAVGLGMGVLIWGVSAAALSEPIRSPVDFLNVGFMISSPSEAIGWGAGFLTGGIAAIMLSSCCRKSDR